ncbi:Retinol dehydrogenase 16 [Plecturocebus cupreus]
MAIENVQLKETLVSEKILDVDPEARLSFHPSLSVSVLCKAMCLYLAVLLGLHHLLRWYQERQVLSYLRDKYVFITGCDSGFRSLLARQLKACGS